jgi:UPF0042 nucleotide-binding protein
MNAQLVIISGRSGSGKSTALHVLEDIGFTCIDNLPASLLPSLAENSERLNGMRYAVSIDARNHSCDLQQLPEIILRSPIQSLNYQILYLDANDEVLLKRFSETRRKHPLSDENTDLYQAVQQESSLLKPVFELANISIDTSEMSYHDLRDFIKRRFLNANEDNATVLFQSFGFKYGLPKDADVVFDVRCLPNPHWESELRSLTGQDSAVKEYLNQQPPVNEMFQDIQQFLERWLPRYKENNRSYITIAIGCTGGQHRSVYLCERLNEHFSQTSSNIQLRHRELFQHD